MADRFSVLSTPAHLTAHEDGSMILDCQTTRGTEVDALRAVETPNWEERQARTERYNRLRNELNLSQELFCYGCGEYHPDEDFHIDNLETTRRKRHKYCKAYRAKAYRYRTGRAELIDAATRARLTKGSQRRKATTS